MKTLLLISVLLLFTACETKIPDSEIITTDPLTVKSLTLLGKYSKIELNWELPEDIESFELIVVRSNTDYPRRIQDGTLLSTITGTSYIDTSVQNGVQYYYSIFTNQDGKTSSPAYVTGRAYNIENVKKAFIQEVKGKLKLTWENPDNDINYAGSIVLRKENSFPSSILDGEAICETTNEECVDENADINKNYYYSIFSYDQNGDKTVSSSKITSVKFDAYPEYKKVILTWNIIINPGIMVRRSTEKFPSNENEGTLVELGVVSDCVDDNLTINTEYYYTLLIYQDGVYYPAQYRRAMPYSVKPIEIFSGDSYQRITTLTWNNPDDSNYWLAKITYKTSSTSTCPSDPITWPVLCEYCGGSKKQFTEITSPYTCFAIFAMTRSEDINLNSKTIFLKYKGNGGDEPF